jgi:small-conductance mechanosensitive channel
MTGVGVTPRVRLGILVAATLLLAAGARAAEDAPAPPPAPAGEVDTAPVRFDGRVLMEVAGISSRPAPERAAAIAARIGAMAADESAPTSSIEIVPTSFGLEIRSAAYPLMVVTAADAALEGASLEIVAGVHRRQIADAIERYRADRQPEEIWRGVLVSAAATAALAGALALFSFLFHRLGAALDRRYQKLLQASPGTVADALKAAPVLRAMRGSLATARMVVALLLVLVWLDVVLGQFPWTRELSENLAGMILGPIGTIAVGIVNYLPKLLFLVVLAVVARFALRMLRLYFGALERGSVSLPNFEPEWSLATYKIIRVVVIGIALVMAYPYLPGAGSEALQGLSVFAGLLISLGASSSVANVIAGYITTFGRVLRIGDLIKVGEVMGVVTQIRLLTVRVRTIRNEEVTIPNSVMVGSNVINYTSLSKERGLVLQTEVSIGYQTPWRQVEAMLLEAARRTEGLMAEPPPFVLQKQLGDFAVVYQLNVHKAEAVGLVQAYSRLHENVLDVFNEYGVQIMTPAYEGDPEVPKVVPKEQWFQAPARPEAKKEGGRA